MINIINSRCPSTDSMSNFLRVWIFSCYTCVLFPVLGMNEANNWRFLLYHSSFVRSILWFTVSKAFLRSRYTPQAKRPLSHAFRICSVISISALFVEWLGLNPIKVWAELFGFNQGTDKIVWFNGIWLRFENYLQGENT